MALSWTEFREAETGLAAFAEERLSQPPAFLATVRADGRPRVHPVTPILAPGGLYVFMEPTSPKGSDLRERGSYAMHNGVPDSAGTGGEVWLTGTGTAVKDLTIRSSVGNAASYQPADRYVLFELLVDEVRCLGYGDVALPKRTRWRA